MGWVLSRTWPAALLSTKSGPMRAIQVQATMHTMKRFWLLFSQSVTVLLAAWFIVATLQPGWLKGVDNAKTVALTQARIEGLADAMPGGSVRLAAQ